MTAEATAIFNSRCERRVALSGMVVDMAGETAAAAIKGDVQCMLCFRLTEVAACTLFAQQGVGHAVAERLQIRRSAGR